MTVTGYWPSHVGEPGPRALDLCGLGARGLQCDRVGGPRYLELVFADGPDPGTWRGLGGMAEWFRDVFRAWEDVRAEAEKYRELDGQRVLVLDHRSGRGKTSGLELGQVRTEGATVWQLFDDRVTRLVLYWDRQRAFPDLRLKE